MAEPTLDGLPTELKIIILFQVPDGDTLKSLILSSPEYHQTYLTVRHVLLEKIVKQQYSGFLDLAEALTAIRSKGIHFAYHRDNAISLLDRWRRRDEIRDLSQTSLSRIDESKTLEEVISLLHFHKKLYFFLEDFSINAPRPPWIHPAQWESEFLPLQLSFSEKHRFLRAACRLQILKNMFGDPVKCLNVNCDVCRDFKWIEWQTPGPDEQMQPWQFREELYRLFYGTMALWERDEMGSVLNYFVSKFNVISQEIADDLRQLSKNTPCSFFWDILPKEQRPPDCCEIQSEIDLVHFTQHCEGLAGLGSEFLYRVLHTDRLSRRNLVCANTRGYWTGPCIGYGVDVSRHIQFPSIFPADRHECRNFEQFWSTLLPLDQPTVGWKKAWLLPHDEGDILEDSVNPMRDLDEDWEWCYAIWDEKRLKEWKAPLLGEDLPGDGLPLR